jgi:hypothetical protein
MIKPILLMGILSFFITLSSQSASAGEIIPGDTVKASSVISMVQSKGYRDVFDLDYYNGKFFVRAIDKDNEIVKIVVDARTNEILHVKDTERHVRGMSHPVSMLDAVRKAEWMGGVRKIYDVDFEGRSFEIIGFNINDHRVEYLVNFNTGKMIRTH